MSKDLKLRLLKAVQIGEIDFSQFPELIPEGSDYSKLTDSELDQLYNLLKKVDEKE